MSVLFRVAGLAAMPVAMLLALTSVTKPATAQELPLITGSVAVPPVQSASPAEPGRTPAVDEQTETDHGLARPIYATLEAAVAAQDPDISDGDVKCLAAAVYHESRSEPLAGQLAVADVVINRSKSHRFPGSICAVVIQPGQFSFVRGGQLPDAPANHDYRVATAVAKLALAGAWSNPAPQALFFHASRIGASGHDTVARIGGHIFYR